MAELGFRQTPWSPNVQSNYPHSAWARAMNCHSWPEGCPLWLYSWKLGIRRGLANSRAFSIQRDHCYPKQFARVWLDEAVLVEAFHLWNVLVSCQVPSIRLSISSRKLTYFVCLKRYGLPVNFQAVLLQPLKKSSTKRLREVLNSVFRHLDEVAATSILDVGIRKQQYFHSKVSILL